MNLRNILISWQLFTSFMVSWVMAPEISSYALRQQTQSIGVCVQAFTSWFFAFVTPYMYNVGSDSGNLGAKTGFVYMGTSILLWAMAWIWLPETKGLSTEDLDKLYERGANPRKFSWEIRQMRRVAEERRESVRGNFELKKFEAEKDPIGSGERDEIGLQAKNSG